ncbi:MAG: fibronectin type III domain-containing protein [Bacteroidales bacterium]|nr:fibronectin type III domain-containing protein [Bacteroidales bacterium]
MLLWLAALSATAQSPGHDVILIGDTTGSMASDVLPFQTFSNTTSQQLVLADEMNGAAMVTGIDFYCTTASATGRDSCQVYLGHTSLSNLTTGMVPFSVRFELVSTETFACTTGWNHYELDSAFFYNGVDNLVLMVCAPGNYYSSIVTFAESNTPGQLLARYANYPYPNMPSYMSTTGWLRRNVMRIHTIPATPASTCPPPTLRFDSIGADAVRMVWSPGYQDTSWVVRCIADGDTAWHSSGLVWGDTTYTMTGLTPNTLYEVRLTAFCSDTETTIVKHLHTNCIPDTVPFREGFESLYNLPTCWSFTRGGTGSLPAFYSDAHTGSCCLQMNGGAAILPLFDVSPDSLELQLWVSSRQGGNVPMQLIVGIVIDPSDMTMFVPFDTITIRNSEGWQPKIVQFEGYARDMGRIALVSLNPALSYFCIDDVQVRRNSFCPTIMGVTVDEVTDSSAVVRWPSTGAAYYEVAYAAYGTDPDSATVVTNVYEDSLLLTGLEAYTRYSVYVRQECYTFAANWSPELTFRTECSLLDSLPFVENMDSYATGTKATDFPCWRGQVTANTCVVNTSSTLPAHSGSRMLRWDQSYSSYGIQHASVPAIDTAVYPINTLQIEFWGMGYAYNRSTPYLIVGVMTDPDDMSTFQAVDTVMIAHNYMEHYVVSLENFRGAGNFITLVDYSPSASQYWQAYLDDITVRELPPCPVVNNVSITSITDHSVTLTIDSTRNAVAWQCRVATDTLGQEPSGNVVIGTVWSTPNGTVPLDSSTTNYLWVRAICVKGDTSEWFGPVSVEPGVWNMRANHIDTMSLCGVTLYDDGGADGTPLTNQNSTLTILPSEAGQLVSISGSCHRGSTYTAVLEIFDGDGTMLWSRAGNENNYNYYYRTLTFGPITSSSGPLTVHYTTNYSLNSSDDFLQIQIDCIPDTCVVKRLRIDTSVPETDTTIAVTWECNGASLYEVEYGPVGFSLGSGTRTTATTEHFVLTGLHSLDRRDIYVRSICGAGDTGEWCHATFQTQPCSEAVYRDNYGPTLGHLYQSVSPLGMNSAQYCYTQTIIDSAYLTGLEEGISAMAVHPYSLAIEKSLTDITVYLANVSDTAFDSTFIVPDSQHTFVMVLDSANFNHGLDTSWLVMPFDRPFLWDGHSNILVATLHNGSVESDGSCAYYNVHVHRRNATCYKTESRPINIDSVTTCYAHRYVGDIRLFSNLCHTVICATPAIDSVGGDYETAALAWHGDGTDYQVKISPDLNGTGIVSTTANSYTFTNLQPATTYTLSVRKDCTGDLLGYSDWVATTFTTETFDCLPPSDFAVTDIDYESATFTWTAGAPCRVRVWDDEGHQWLYGGALSPFILDEFVSGRTYHAAISSYCGSSQQIEGAWSEPFTFATPRCLPPSDFAISRRTSHSVTLTWTTDSPCRLRLWGEGDAEWHFDSVMAPFTIDNLAEGNTYYASISRRCGSREPESVIWSDSLAFYTACHPIDNLHIQSTTSHSIQMAWDAARNAQDYQLQYGRHPYSLVEGADTIVTGNSCLIDNLSAATGYDIYVRTRCDQEWYAADYVSILNVFTQNSSGVEAIDPSDDFILTPNPAHSHLSIIIKGVSSQAELTIHDAAGRKVRHFALRSSSSAVFDIADLPSGIYFVTLTTPIGSATKKLVKQ